MKTRVYLAGPIADCSEAEAGEWRNRVAALLGDGFECIDPFRNDWRGVEKELFREIVESDKNDINGCDILLANVWKIGVGTSMEILYAWERHKDVYIVAPDGKVSPWISYHSAKVFPSIEAAVDFIRYFYT